MVDGYSAATSLNTVDSDPVPVPHFGLALTVDQFHALSARMKEAKVSVPLLPCVAAVHFCSLEALCICRRLQLE
jgi:extradiol dioxygenase family protein